MNGYQRPRPVTLGRHRVVWGLRVCAFTLDLWGDQVVLGRVGGLERWRKLAHLCWRPRRWREAVYVRPPWGRRDG